MPENFQTVHILCYHGMGDAIRYAFPLAHSYCKTGCDVYLHVRSDLVACIGEQPDLSGIITVNNEFFANFPDGYTAACEYAGMFENEEKIIIIGSSSLEQNLRRVFTERKVDFYHWDNRLQPDTSSNKSDEKNNLEFYRTLSYVCFLHGVELLDKGDYSLNPLPEFKNHPFKNSDKLLVGVHCKAL